MLITVPGARLYAERAGQGPALVLISGGGGDAGMYEAAVPLLARRYTVLTFDRRGNSRSPLEGSRPMTMADQAADVVAVLDHHGVERAHVFGNSGGATIALEVLARHGDRLLGAVVHEPPLLGLLPDGLERDVLTDLVHISETESPLRAFVAFAAMTMPKAPRLFRSAAGRAVTAAALSTALALGSVTGRPPGGMARLLGNVDIMFRREVPVLLNYQPDFAALSATDVPWCPATGRDSVGRPYYLPAHILGDRVGVPCVDFPGGHTSYQQDPEAFTSRLTEVLEGFSA